MEIHSDYQPNEEWAKPRGFYGLYSAFRVVGPFFILVGAAPWLWLWLSPWAAIALIPFIGAFTHKITLLVHDCSHFSLFQNKRTNIVVGWVLGAFIATNFESFRRVHWYHHGHLGEEEEPQALDYFGLKKSSSAALIWHLVKPLFGAHIGRSILVVLPFRKSPSKGFEVDTDKGEFQVMWFLLLVVIAQGILATLATGFGRVWWLVALFPFSAATFGLFCARVRSFCEHVPPLETGDEAFVRTHLPNWFDKLFIFDVNFSYHIEHHLYPKIASCYLPEIHNVLKKRGDIDSGMISPGIRFTLKNRIRQAGDPSLLSPVA